MLLINRHNSKKMYIEKECIHFLNIYTVPIMVRLLGSETKGIKSKKSLGNTLYFKS